ncbi:hypothetical protein IV102_15095 [bacterium]|nr:hypothetical protein [bacterium]
MQLHLMVEQQIRARDPEFVAEAALRLERAGIHPHDVRHLLAIPMVHQAFSVIQNEIPYDSEKHRRAIEEILSEHLPSRR